MPSVIREGNLPVFESETSQKAYLGESHSTPSGTSKDILGQNAHFFYKNLTSQCWDVPPTAAQRYDVPVSKFEDYMRVKNIRGTDEFVNHDFYETRSADLCAVRLSVTSWAPLAVQ